MTLKRKLSPVAVLVVILASLAHLGWEHEPNPPCEATVVRFSGLGTVILQITNRSGFEIKFVNVWPALTRSVRKIPPHALVRVPTALVSNREVRFSYWREPSGVRLVCTRVLGKVGITVEPKSWEAVINLPGP